jgi:endonuclease/exonuclease/phosphatase family metal-dependent hydrolase
MTRHRIVRYATVSLEFDELWPAGAEPQRGWVCAVELITRRGQPVCLWVVDMPSSPLLPRHKAMQQAMEQIRSWTVTATVMDQQGIRTTEPMAGVPLPDLVVGDFNTPRWSASLDAFTSKRVLDLDEVSSAVGHGPSGTFPSPWSVLPIDLVFTGEGWRGISHQTHVLPNVRHRAVSVTVGPVEPVGPVREASRSSQAR